MMKSIIIDGETISTVSISSLDFQTNIKRILTYIKKDILPTTENIQKLYACTFLVDKLYGYYNIKKDDNDFIIKTYSSIIIDDKTINEPIKTRHSHFRNAKNSFMISNNLYNEHNKEGTLFKLNVNTYFQILKHLLRCDIYISAETNLIVNIHNELETIFANPITSLFVKMEIADIFINSGRIIRGNELLQIIRRENGIRPEIRKNKNVFGDSQNVHNSTINQTVISVGSNLIKYISNVISIGGEIIRNVKDKNPIKINNIDIQFLSDFLCFNIDEFNECFLKIHDELVNEVDLEQVQLHLQHIYPESSIFIKACIERISMETTIFEHFTLLTLFNALWKFISIHKYSIELKNRLVEEMKEMYNYCTTGHLSRLINTIQGFTVIDDLQIKISSKDQIKASVTAYLSKCLETAPDEILDNMLDTDKTLFTNYVLKLVEQNYNTWYNDYGDDFKIYIKDIINEYTNGSK